MVLAVQRARIVRWFWRASQNAQRWRLPACNDGHAREITPVQHYYSTSTKTVPQGLQTGDVIHGYKVEKVTEVPELFLTMVSLRHLQTGAQHLHAARDDDNNTFSVMFRTTPMDSSGVPHILEHTVLCGSKRFPVRDPFFKMLSRSMSNFMNALTAYDWTMYPFSTQNYQDFRNLLSVYLDAVFHPLIREADFRQEGWRLEQENLEKPDSPLIFKGVVYNEMKGVFSSSQNIFSQECHNRLQPHHTYGVVSGGDPRNISELTWEALRDFHASHYHPSNARFFTYGNFPLEDHLHYINSQYLQHFSSINPNTSVPPQPRWQQPRTVTVTCPPDPMAPNPEKQTTVAVNFLLSDITNAFDAFCLGVMGTLLVDGETAPFYSSLLEANIGSDYAPTTGQHAHTRESTFSVGLQGIHKDDVEKVIKIIDNTIDKVIKEGFEQKRIDSLLHRIELSLKHQTSNFGFHLSIALASPWNHDADPVEMLQINEAVTRFKQALQDNPRLLQDLVAKHLKDNPHRLTVVMTPDENFAKEREEEEKRRLEKLTQGLTAEDKGKILERGRALLASQMAQEDLSCLPSLRVEDIDKKVRPETLAVEDMGGVPVQWSAQATNQVTYLRLLCNMAALPSDLLPYVPLFCSVITKMGAGGLDYKELSQQMELYTGGFSSSVHVCGHPSQQLAFQQGIIFSSHCLERNLEHMLKIWTDIFTSGDVTERDRLSTLVQMLASDMAAGLSQSGHSYALTHAASALSPVNRLQETLSGITQVSTMKKVAENPNFDDIISKLQAVGRVIMNKDNMRLALNATPEAMDTTLGSLGTFLGSLPGAPQRGDPFCQVLDFEPSVLRTQFELPFSVNFVSQATRSVSYTHPDFPRLQVLAKLLSRKFLHREIREKGGAYGSGAVSGIGQFCYFSYRDPNSLQTLEVFDKAGQWAAKGDFSDQDVQEAKLGVFQETDRPVAPGSIGSRFFLTSISDDMRQTNRDRLFDVSKKDVMEVANSYLVGSGQWSTCFLGPANASVQEDSTWRVSKET